MNLIGHYRTERGVLHGLGSGVARRGQPFTVELVDRRVGSVTLSGLWFNEARSRDLLLVVHGLGGHARVGYMLATALAARKERLDCLLLNTRGSDYQANDFGHAGLTADLEAALASPLLARYERVFLLGYSLGGHLCLSYALGRPDARLCSVAAVCAPLDLASSARFFDTASAFFYRKVVMQALYAIYRAATRRRAGPIPLSEARRIDRIRIWDELVVAPHHGFRDRDTYYREMSVAPNLSALRHPALYVGALDDPMVPRAVVADALSSRIDRLTTIWVERAGHVGFPPRTSLGCDAPLGLEHQVLAWLRDSARSSLGVPSARGPDSARSLA